MSFAIGCRPMPTELVKGDIFEDEARAFAFPADASGSMDAGIAVAFKKRWPALAEAFAARCEGGKLQVGDVFTWRGDGVVVYALALQKDGNKAKVSWFERAMQAMVEHASKDAVTRVALPRIGGAKVGLDPSRVKRVLTDVGGATTVHLVVYEQFVRAKPDAG